MDVTADGTLGEVELMSGGDRTGESSDELEKGNGCKEQSSPKTSHGGNERKEKWAI